MPRRQKGQTQHSFSLTGYCLQENRSLAIGHCVAGRRLLFAQLGAAWPVWLIGLAGLGMYALVYVEPRHIAAFFALIWVGLFADLKMPSDRSCSRVVAAVTFAVVLAITTPTAVTASRQWGNS